MIPILIIIFCIQVATIRSDCNYEQYISGRTIALRRNRADYIIISTKQRIPADRSVELFCGSGFESNNSSGDSGEKSTLGKMMTVNCRSSGAINYRIDNSTNQSFSDQHFTCPPFSPSFYAEELDYCQYEGFFYGVEIKSTPIVLAEFCFDYNNYTKLIQEVISVHYVAGKRNSLLSKQKDYNPSEEYNKYKLDEASKITPLKEEYPPIILENNFTIFNPRLRHLQKQIHYEFHELVPTHLYSGHFHDSTGDMKFSNAIPWWMPLKDGNWETFQRLLAKETSERSYEIYAGQSGAASYPEDFVWHSINELTYEFNEEQKNIPLYIWNYIIRRNHYNGESEFVLIAINSPFIESVTKNSFVLCDDICDQIDWLKPLGPTRLMASFGYIFCCKPDDVKNELRGFPVSSKNEEEYSRSSENENNFGYDWHCIRPYC